jgi:hypothetical protein
MHSRQGPILIELARREASPLPFIETIVGR